MRHKHQKIFALFFEKPDRKDIDWDDFLNLLLYLGASIKHKGGSAHGVKLNGVYMVFHKPHPGHTLYAVDVRRIREFFICVGISKVE